MTNKLFTPAHAEKAREPVFWAGGSLFRKGKFFSFERAPRNHRAFRRRPGCFMLMGLGKSVFSAFLQLFSTANDYLPAFLPDAR